MFNTDIKSMFDLHKTFPDEQSCIDYLENLFWAGKPVSPYDPESKVYKLANNYYKCKNTGKKFNIRTGTFLQSVNIPLQKVLFALWIITSHKKGISSVQLAKDIGITQKSAWFLAHRIRACFGMEQEEEKFEGIIECDETFVGGKNKNRHKDKKCGACQGRAFKDKTPIVGILHRGKSEIMEGRRVNTSISKVKLFVTDNTAAKTIQPIIRRNVTKDSVLITDEWNGYRGMHYDYDHHIVDHKKKQYVDYENKEIHSNSIEGFWSILKRSYNGIYNWWSKKHMQKYAEEFAFRFNSRDLKDGERFNLLLLNSGVRTRYKDLIK